MLKGVVIVKETLRETDGAFIVGAITGRWEDIKCERAAA
jgi:hypothetical protein